MKFSARFLTSATNRCCFTGGSFEKTQNREVVLRHNGDADNLRLLVPCLRIFSSVCICYLNWCAVLFQPDGVPLAYRKN